MCISCLDRFQSTDYEGLGPSRLWSVYFLFGSISVFYLWSEVQVFYGLCISCLGRFQSTDYEEWGPSLLLSVYLLFGSISVCWLWKARAKSFIVCVSLVWVDFSLLTRKSEVQVFYCLCISCFGRFQSTDYEEWGPSLLWSVYLLLVSILIYWLWSRWFECCCFF